MVGWLIRLRSGTVGVVMCYMRGWSLETGGEGGHLITHDL